MSGPYPPQQPYSATPIVPVILTDQQVPSTAVVVVAWIVAAFTAFYMLPWAIAATRGKSDQWPIFAINLLLGWSLIGWIAALVMAVSAHRPIAAMPGAYLTPVVQVPAANPPGWYPNPNGPGSRYWDGRAWTNHLA
jgi:hypothetical protein